MTGGGISLGVNIDHVATLRQARRGRHPDPVHAALTAEIAGADSITRHLREDRRHIQDHDVRTLRGLLQTRMNLEPAVTDEMLAITADGRPPDCCLVPERRQETPYRRQGGVRVALFIDPNPQQVEAAAHAGAPVIELHTGAYAEAAGATAAPELGRLRAAARLGASLGLEVHAGHGLNYRNVHPVAALREIVELNIGHALIAHALFVGLPAAVREMKALMAAARA